MKSKIFAAIGVATFLGSVWISLSAYGKATVCDTYLRESVVKADNRTFSRAEVLDYLIHKEVVK